LRRGKKPSQPTRWTVTVRLFVDFTKKQIRSGVHRSTAELEAAIRTYIDATNVDPKAFRSSKFADDILASKRLLLETLSTAHAQIAGDRNEDTSAGGGLSRGRDSVG
jgi:hypothetical protein